MSLTLNEENLKEAYFNILECTGIGAAANNGEQLLPQNVLVAVPQDMHENFPARLLECAKNICAKAPYEWTVENREPVIDDDTTFQSLWDEWLTEIISG